MYVYIYNKYAHTCITLKNYIHVDLYAISFVLLHTYTFLRTRSRTPACVCIRLQSLTRTHKLSLQFTLTVRMAFLPVTG